MSSPTAHRAPGGIIVLVRTDGSTLRIDEREAAAIASLVTSGAVAHHAADQHLARHSGLGRDMLVRES